MGHQCALVVKKANGILGCIKECGQKAEGGDLPPLLCPGEATFRLLCPISSNKFKKDRDLLEGVQWRATKIIKGLEHLSFEERLRDMGLRRILSINI